MNSATKEKSSGKGCLIIAIIFLIFCCLLPIQDEGIDISISISNNKKIHFYFGNLSDTSDTSKSSNTTSKGSNNTSKSSSNTTIVTTLEEVESMNSNQLVGSKYSVTKEDYIHLCNLVAREYGSDFVPVSEKAKVAQTVFNRIDSKSFAENTVKDVINAKNQYGVTYDKNGNAHNVLSRTKYSSKVTKSVKEAVLYCLNGNCKDEKIVFYFGNKKQTKNFFYETYKAFEVAYVNEYGKKPGQ